MRTRIYRAEPVADQLWPGQGWWGWDERRRTSWTGPARYPPAPVARRGRSKTALLLVLPERGLPVLQRLRPLPDVRYGQVHAEPYQLRKVPDRLLRARLELHPEGKHWVRV